MRAQAQQVLQPHEGASETVDCVLEHGTGALLQPHKGPSETAVRWILNGTRRPRFNPTRVRLKRGARPAPTPAAPSFNPTRVRLKRFCGGDSARRARSFNPTRVRLERTGFVGRPIRVVEVASTPQGRV